MHHQQRNNNSLLVVSTDLRGATILVSGVEEMDTSPEDPVVHLSSPVPGRGIWGRDSLLAVSFVTAPGSTLYRFVCSFPFEHHHVIMHHIIHVSQNKNYFINPKLFSFPSLKGYLLNPLSFL
jgi:hypothetical protein